MSDLSLGATINKGGQLLHTASVTGKKTFVEVLEINLNPRNMKERTWIKLKDPCGREWKAYGSIWLGDDYSDFKVISKGQGRGGFAKRMQP